MKVTERVLGHWRVTAREMPAVTVVARIQPEVIRA
jgi:hypothetical protein